MGTNYYVERVSFGYTWKEHVGKQSAGWPFLFAEHEHATTAAQWATIITSPTTVDLLDEYGRVIHPHDFWTMVERNKQKVPLVRGYDDWGYYKERDGYWFVLCPPEDWS